MPKAISTGRRAPGKYVETGLAPGRDAGIGGSTATGTRGSGGDQFPSGGATNRASAAGGRGGNLGAHYGYASAESVLGAGSLGHNSKPGR
jgi:hypothetical protein